MNNQLVVQGSQLANSFKTQVPRNHCKVWKSSQFDTIFLIAVLIGIAQST